MNKSEAERLSEYFPFDSEVLSTVSEVAERQRSLHFDDLVLPSTFVPRRIPGEKRIKVVDINPDDGYDETIVFHLPLGYDLDEAKRMQMHTLSQVLRSHRIIAVGNPSASVNSFGKLPHVDLKRVWQGDLSPVLSPVSEYLHSHKIGPTIQAGYSYGAEKAATAAKSAREHNLEVTGAILIDPQSIIRSTLLRYTIRNIRNFRKASEFAVAANSQVYKDTRSSAEISGHGKVGRNAALARASNLAIAHGISSGSFSIRMKDALISQPQMTASIVRTARKGLVNNVYLPHEVSLLQKEFGDQRLDLWKLDTEASAIEGDVFLLSAIVLQALRNIKKNQVSDKQSTIRPRRLRLVPASS